MSADEIRRLAEDCHRKAYIFGQTAERLVELKKESALLAYADMIERCERLLGCTFYLEDGHTNIDHIIKHQLNYILRGDAEKEEK